MKLIASVKVECDEAKQEKLLATLRSLNQAADWLSYHAFQLRCFSAFALHKKFYRALRSLFGPSAQMAVRVCGKVAAAYARDSAHRISFRETGGFPFDQRLYSFLHHDTILSLRLLKGRIKLPVVLGEYQRALL